MYSAVFLVLGVEFHLSVVFWDKSNCAVLWSVRSLRDHPGKCLQKTNPSHKHFKCLRAVMDDFFFFLLGSELSSVAK